MPLRHLNVNKRPAEQVEHHKRHHQLEVVGVADTVGTCCWINGCIIIVQAMPVCPRRDL